MWEEHFAWLPVETNKGWKWLTTIQRKMVRDFDSPNGVKFIYKVIDK